MKKEKKKTKLSFSSGHGNKKKSLPRGSFGNEKFTIIIF
jgi:hypothetical protein